VSDAEEPQREITRLALRSLDGTGFALAGSGAIREHGLVDRPTEDVDLFTSDVDLFARLEVTTADGHQVDIDMGADWREAEPAVLAIGPVLSLETPSATSSARSTAALTPATSLTSTRSAHPRSSRTPS